MTKFIRCLTLAAAGTLAAALSATADDAAPKPAAAATQQHQPGCACTCHAAAGNCTCACHARAMADKELMPPAGQKMDRAPAKTATAQELQLQRLPSVPPKACQPGCTCACHSAKCTCTCHAAPMTDKELLPPAGQKMDRAPATATPAIPSEKSGVSSITMLVGYSESNLKYGQKDYKLVPVALRLPLTEWRHSDESRVRGSLFLEPYAGYVISPNDNYEVGVPLFVRYSVPVGSSGFSLFADAGAGPMYMSQRTAEQGSKLNLIGMAGAGVRYACTESVDLELGYRFRYVSNANLKDSNTGIDGHTVFLGLTYRY